MLRSLFFRRLPVCVVALVMCCAGHAGEEVSRAVILERVTGDIRYFASDDLEGRGLETKGIRLAAERIISEFENLGVRPGMPDGSWVQPFPVTLGAMALTDSTGVVLHGPDGNTLTLKLGDQFQPIRRGKNGSASGPLVFVGYGISADDENYDDYAKVNVKDRVVVMVRREPRQGQENGGFAGTATSPHAYIDLKIEQAVAHGAAAIIFVNDPFTHPAPDKDELSPVTGFGNEGDSVPFVHVRQAVIDQLLAASPLMAGDRSLSSLREACDYIDETLKPVSQELAGWSADVTTGFEAESVIAENIIGVIEGEGPLAEETIVIGGHYDHLGFGGYGSRARNREGEIHNGADDNATGTAAVLELARRIATGPKPGRRVVLICFSAEERGLLGSNYYVQNPVFPLEQTVIMLNFDMIGTLRNNRVEVNGVGTAAEFRELVQTADAAQPVDITIVDSPFGGSDHLPFYQKQIPVMFCFTGTTDRYHTPDDDFETINVDGTVAVIDYAAELYRLIDAMPKRPTFISVSRGPRRSTRQIPSLGFAPELSETTESGVLVRTVRENSPAAVAGIQVADLVTHVDGNAVDGFRQIIEVLTRSKPGDKMKLTVKRGEETLELTVELGEPGR